MNCVWVEIDQCVLGNCFHLWKWPGPTSSFLHWKFIPEVVLVFIWKKRKGKVEQLQSGDWTDHINLGFHPLSSIQLLPTWSIWMCLKCNSQNFYLAWPKRNSGWKIWQEWTSTCLNIISQKSISRVLSYSLKLITVMVLLQSSL